MRVMLLCALLAACGKKDATSTGDARPTAQLEIPDAAVVDAAAGNAEVRAIFKEAADAACACTDEACLAAVQESMMKRMTGQNATKDDIMAGQTDLMRLQRCHTALSRGSTGARRKATPEEEEEGRRLVEAAADAVCACTSIDCVQQAAAALRKPNATLKDLELTPETRAFIDAQTERTAACLENVLR